MVSPELYGVPGIIPGIIKYGVPGIMELSQRTAGIKYGVPGIS